MPELPGAKRYVSQIQSTLTEHRNFNQHEKLEELTEPLHNSVRREEILSRTSTSPSPSPPPLPETAVQDGHQRLGELLNLDALFADANTNPSASNETSDKGQDIDAKQNGQEEEEDEEKEFEFRLFSAPSAARKPTVAAGGGKEEEKTGGDNTKVSNGNNATTTQKLRIRLRSPTPGPTDISEGRFVNPFRGWGYYFTAPALLSGTITGDETEDVNVARRRKQFEEVAVSGQNVLGWADVPWVSTWILLFQWTDNSNHFGSQPGCHLPWRVIHLKRQSTRLPRTSEAPAVYVTDPDLSRTPKSHKRPGKKRRVQLRKRLTAAETAKQEEAEKRNRKNRERKIKRRQKNRETKAAATGGSAEAGDVAMADADDASSGAGDD